MSNALLEGLRQSRELGLQEGLAGGSVVAPDRRTQMAMAAQRAFDHYWALYQAGAQFVQD